MNNESINKVKNTLASQIRNICRSISYLSGQGYLVNQAKFVKTNVLNAQLHIVENIGLFENKEVANNIIKNINQSLIV